MHHKLDGKMWENAETPQKQKHKGIGGMCSGINKCEFGYVKQLALEKFETVNKF